MGCVVLLKETERVREAWKLSSLYIANFVTCSGYGKDWAKRIKLLREIPIAFYDEGSRPIIMAETGGGEEDTRQLNVPSFQGSTYPISKPQYKSRQEGIATHPFLHQLLEANHALAHALLVAKVAYECLAVHIGS